MDNKAGLGVVDYVMFALMLIISAAIGVYFRFSGGKQKTTEEYLLAGQDMSILPVAFSLMVSFMAGSAIIGAPAEVYHFGLNILYIDIGFTIGIILTGYLSLPVFFDMKLPTIYEYLERRFGKTIRTLTSLAFVLQMILYMGVVLYAPALSLSAVTNLSIWVSVISIGIVCTFYCTLGGMKAVLWTDAFQAVLMFLGLFTVIFKGFADVGFYEMFRIANEGGRLNSPAATLDFEVRYTWLNILIQGIIMSLTCFSGNQVQIQRMLTVKNITRSRMALFLNVPVGIVLHILTCFTGIVVYAYYHDCDPLTAPNKPISSADQLVPYYMADALSPYPGLAGLCICGIFSASLSTVSSAVNSLAAVTMEDFVRPIFASRGISLKKATFTAKIITLLYGVVCICLTFLVATFGNLVQASITIFGLLGSPVMAIFLLGMLTTRANEKGVVFGFIVSIIINAWVSFAGSAYAPPPVGLPVSIQGCPSLNSSSHLLPLNTTFPATSSDIAEVTLLAYESQLNQTNIIQDEYEDIFPIYRISYMWYSPIGFFSAIIFGYLSSVIISLITGESKTPDHNLLSPMFKYFLKKKPKEIIKEEMKNSAHIDLQRIDGTYVIEENLKNQEKISYSVT